MRKTSSRPVVAHYRSSPLASSHTYLSHGSSTDVADISAAKEVSDLILSISDVETSDNLEMAQIQNWILHHFHTGLGAISMDWNVFADHSDEEFIGLFLAIFVREGFVNTPSALEALYRYTETIRNGYQETPYHNFYHAVDVTCMTYYLLKDMGIKEQADLTSIDVIGLLLAAVGHDVLHPGTNNVYQVNTKSPIAEKYENKSVLEKYSLDFIKETLTKTSLIEKLSFLDVPASTDKSDIEEAVLEVISEAVLKTDMSFHFSMLDALGKYSDYLEDASPSVRGSFNNLQDIHTNTQTWHNKNSPVMLQSALTTSTDSLCKIPVPDGHIHQLLVNSVLHAADISNPARPFHICEKWSELVIEEFFRQGDLEHAAQLPISPNMERSKTDPIKVQIAFSDFIVKPFFETLSEIFPRTLTFLDILSYNTKQWSSMAYSQSPTLTEEPVEPEQTSETESPETTPTSSPSISTTGSISPTRRFNNIPFFPHRKMPSAPADPKQANIAYLGHPPSAPRRLSLAAGTIELPDDFDRFYNRRNSRDRHRSSGTSSTGLPHLSPSHSFSKSFSNARSYQMRHINLYNRSNLSSTEYLPNLSESVNALDQEEHGSQQLLNQSAPHFSRGPYHPHIGDSRMALALGGGAVELQRSRSDFGESSGLGAGFSPMRRRSKSTGDTFFDSRKVSDSSSQGYPSYSGAYGEECGEENDAFGTYNRGDGERFLMPNSASFRSERPASSLSSSVNVGSVGNTSVPGPESLEELMKATTKIGTGSGGTSSGGRSSMSSIHSSVYTPSRVSLISVRNSISGPFTRRTSAVSEKRNSIGTAPGTRRSSVAVEKRGSLDTPHAHNPMKSAHVRRKATASGFSSIASGDVLDKDTAEEEDELAAIGLGIVTGQGSGDQSQSQSSESFQSLSQSKVSRHG